MQGEFEDTKGVIRIGKSKKDRQHNGKKRTNNDLQNIKQKTKARVTRIQLGTLLNVPSLYMVLYPERSVRENNFRIGNFFPKQKTELDLVISFPNRFLVNLLKLEKIKKLNYSDQTIIQSIVNKILQYHNNVDVQLSA